MFVLLVYVFVNYTTVINFGSLQKNTDSSLFQAKQKNKAL